MRVLIKQAIVVSADSPFNGQTKDIFIEDGMIASIADNITENYDQLIQHKGLHVSIGWMDSFANFCDPGFEYRESFETGAAAAAAGGFTDIMIIPNTSPAIYTKSQVEYVVQKSSLTGVTIHPIGAVTKNAGGKELAEMYDMANSGAIAFSDGLQSIQDGGLLLKALLYLKTIGATVIQLPDDKSIGSNGLMNEGIISTQLGLPGKPAMSEELMVARDIKLANYAEGRLHFTGISSAKSLDYIKEAKTSGINITCSVTPYHLYFCDEDLQQYDTNLKVNPPLRTGADREALLEGLLDGTIDFIASHHNPQNYDNKVCEFEYAKNGMIGLESLFGVLGSVINNAKNLPVNDWPIEKLIYCLSIAPRKLFGITVPELKEGAKATLTLFDPAAEYIFDEKYIRSKSKNSAFVGKQLKGKVIGIVNGNKIHLN
ncbi:MAG: dihydroorotase [Ferruginibacter sp.]|nr:dihydroorotase [Ferruginibacter sp.]